MQVVMSKEANRNGYPMDKIITTPWINDVDLANIGHAAAKGLKKVSTFTVGSNLPLIAEIKKELYAKSKGNGDAKWIGDNYYNFALASFAPVFEGAKLAIKKEGHPLTSEKLRRGIESVRNFNADGLLAPLNITDKDHSGGGKTRIDMWDGSKWVPQTDWSAEYSDLVWATVKASSAEYVKSGK
jgi:branched-chain amino acid transport system substrate-binding protein